MIDRMLEFYPEKEKTPYYVEFSQWEGRPVMWQLFRRQFLPYPDPFTGEPQSEVHPWNLGEGEVNLHEGVVSMNTKQFLCFMVDALNEKAVKETV